MTTPFWDTTPAGHVARRLGMFITLGFVNFVDYPYTGAQPVPINTFDFGGVPNIDQWVATAARGSAGFATLVVKDVNGLPLWNTATTTHNVTHTSWYGSHPTDIIQTFVDSCFAHAIVPYFYFDMHDDWYQLYSPTGPMGGTVNQADYKIYVEAQLTELLTNYGPIGGIFLDETEFYWGNASPWASNAARAAFIHGLQSTCLILNNAHTAAGGTANGDIYVFEDGNADVPGGNTNPAEFIRSGFVDHINQYAWRPNLTNAYDTISTATTLLTTYKSRNAALHYGASPTNTGVLPSDQVATWTGIGDLMPRPGVLVYV